MADLKISQLTGATTPLAGTEVVPLVQSSTTKKVSVADLTAGRSQTSNGIVQGTAGTGYNFTANTGAAGMTSQLLNWYEEGTWTPTVTPELGSLTSYTSSGIYTRIGRTITLNFKITITNAGTASGSLQISGLPFSINSALNASGCSRETAVNGYLHALSAVLTTRIDMVRYDNATPFVTNANFPITFVYSI